MECPLEKEGPSEPNVFPAEVPVWRYPVPDADDNASDPDTDADVIAEAVVEQFETVSEEFSSVDAEDIVPNLEATMEIKGSQTNSL